MRWSYKILDSQNKTVSSVEKEEIKCVRISKEGIKIEEIYAPLIETAISVIPFTRDIKTEIITVNDTPTLILKPPHPTCYLLINPTVVVGATRSYTVWDETFSDTSGNTQNNPVSVTSFEYAYIHLNVTGVSGVWKFTVQSQDPYTLNWADVKDIDIIDAPGTYFYNVDIDNCIALAIKWEELTGGGGGFTGDGGSDPFITFSASVTCKKDIYPVSGLARAIFIGNKTVTPETGIPLYEGEKIVIRPIGPVDIYATALKDMEVKIEAFWL